MRLSAFNVDEALRQKTIAFLIENASFAAIRPHVLSKAPVSSFIDSLKSTFSTLHDQDKAEKQSELEDRAKRRQIEEDITEKEHDLREEGHDQSERSILVARQNELRQRIAALDINITANQLRLTVLNAHHHPNPRADVNISLEKGHIRQAILNEELIRSDLISQLHNVTHKLEQTLPQRNANRRLRGEARTARKQASRMPDPYFAQLSDKNRQKLQTEVHAAFQRLDQQRRQLITDSEKKAHGIYLSVLIEQLSAISLTEPERLALRNMARLMQQHLIENEHEARARATLRDATATLQQAQRTLHTKQQTIEREHETKGNFQSQNKDLEQKNITLKKRLDNQTLPFWASLAIGIIMLTGIAGFFFAIPIAIPIVAMVVSVLAFGVTGFSAYISSNLKEEMAQNEQTIQDNQHLMATESFEIPQLQSDILRQQNAIQDIEKQISEHVTKGASLLDRATNTTIEPININSTYRGGLFTQPEQPTPVPDFFTESTHVPPMV